MACLSPLLFQSFEVYPLLAQQTVVSKVLRIKLKVLKWMLVSNATRV